LLESLLVAVFGVSLAFLANALSPRGLTLTRDFFGASSQTATNLAATTYTNTAVAVNGGFDHEQLVARLRGKGLELADSNQVLQLFQDPRRLQGMVLFVDARDDNHYQQGHIPDAYQLDYYHPDNYLGALLPFCQVAQQVVVYCAGGQCEDSEFAATFLISAGIAKEKLLVYGGGMAEWATSGMPVEIGGRSSGLMRPNTAR
jgi:rhodanese-related sulfurtransferase